MNDKELLEKAAKAAGIKALCGPDGITRDCTGFYPEMNIFAAKPWNPLTDDADALRLAVKLVLDIGHTVSNGVHVTGFYEECMGIEQLGDDPYAATRRAIVRAAAAIGETME